jgi:uncharacterized SAM-binding protein YcdF (DUF218 family)
MTSRFFQRRTIWCPTLLGWTCLVVIALAVTTVWWSKAEAFLSASQRQSADILVVESWIGLAGLDAAKAEFERGGYRYLVSAGGLSHNPWDQRRWNFADEAEEYLVRTGIPRAKIIVARQKDTRSQRTFETAVASWQALQAAAMRPKAVNVFTVGAHCRRSRLIFAKVFGSDTPVGVVSWVPPAFEGEPWWHSSERAEDLIKETVGYLFEILLNSGRTSNSPPKSAAPPETGKP